MGLYFSRWNYMGIYKTYNINFKVKKTINGKIAKGHGFYL